MDITIYQISADQTYPLRHQVLRPHQPIEMCYYPGDNLPGAFHLGAHVESKIVGIISVAPDSYSKFKEKSQFRIRGMAVAPEFRKRQIGTQLVKESMKMLKSAKANLVWFNAREVAFGFYENLGFVYQDGLFEIEGIGLHKVMYSPVATWPYYE